MIVHIINIENIPLVIPENNPVVRTYLDRPEPGVIARQTVNSAAQSLDIILRCHGIKGIQDQGDFCQIVGGKFRPFPFSKNRRNPLCVIVCIMQLSDILNVSRIDTLVNVKIH